MKKQPIFCYIAAVCFLIETFVSVVDFFDCLRSDYLRSKYLLECILTLAIAIALLLRSRQISTISFGALSVWSLYPLISSLYWYIRLYEYASYRNSHSWISNLYSLLLFASYILLFISCLSPKKAKVLGIASVGIYFVRIAALCIQEGCFPSGRYTLRYIVAIAGILFAGFALYGEMKDSAPRKRKAVKPQEKTAISARPQSSIAGNYDNLIKLKTLLDNNAITQEEFDAKKKQMLGL